MQKRRQRLGDRMYSVPCRASSSILHQDDLKNRMNSSFFSYHPGAIHPFLHVIRVQFILFFISSWCKIARNWIISVPQTAATTFAFSLSWLYPSSMCRTLQVSKILCLLAEHPKIVDHVETQISKFASEYLCESEQSSRNSFNPNKRGIPAATK